MKIAALIRSYHATEYLDRVLRNYAWVDKILVMNYRFLTVEPTTDDTAEIAARYPNVELVKGEGIAQHEILNEGMARLKGFDYVFVSDADEFILPLEQRQMVDFMKDNGKTAGFCMVKDYHEDPFHCLPQRKGHFLAIAKPGAVKFTHIRQVSFDRNGRKDFPYLIHHFGFALRPDHLDWKIGWESAEERVNVRRVLKSMIIERYDPPSEILDILSVEARNDG